MIEIRNFLSERVGLGFSQRILHSQFSNTTLTSQVLVQCIMGKHEINHGLEFDVLCFSQNPNLELKQFIGSQIAIDIVTDLRDFSRTTGVITSAIQGSYDGGLCIYQLKVQDAFALLKQRRGSRVFMGKNVIQITKIIFEECLNQSFIIKKALKLDITGLKKHYDSRPFCMMFEENYYDFLTRLWRSEGINWLISEHIPKISDPYVEMEPQKIRLIDDNNAFDILDRKSIRFHSRSHATEYYDTITSLTAEHKLRSTLVRTQRWHPEWLDQDNGTVLSSRHKYSEKLDNESISLDQVWNLSPAWTADLNGQDQANKASSKQLERFNQQILRYQDLQAKSFKAKTSVRDAHVGYYFQLDNHFELDTHHHSSDREFIIISKRFFHQNNLPKEVFKQVDDLVKQSDWRHLQINQDEMHGTELSLVRYSTPIVPEYDPHQHRPQSYPMRAIVVGPTNEKIHVDEWGSVKVRFPFTLIEHHQVDANAGASGTASDSAWVPVMTSWAGSDGEGIRFHPRVGDEVVINFFNGDIDRPFVAGSLYESRHEQTNFDRKGSLPYTKKLSGIRTSEVGGSGFNQLRFDDTTGQISAQLQSSHAATQLNLGNLSHPKVKETSAGRGEGFELRTDAYGAMRAGKGMLITTYAQENAVAAHLDAVQAQHLLNQANESMKMLSNLAVKQQTDALKVINRLPKLIQSLELKNTSQALQATLDIFKENITSDPLGALKDCTGFISDIGQFGGVSDIMNDFNSFMGDASGALDNLKGFIGNIEDFGTDKIKNTLSSVKENLTCDPFSALQSVGDALSSVSLSDFNLSNLTSALTGGGSGLSGLLGSVQSFMQSFTDDSSSSSSEQSHNGTLFRQALMLFASPNGIAMTTPEDVMIHASQDIGLSTGGSINNSSQKDIVSHSQGKYSAFAVNGISLYSAKNDIKLQSQDGIIEAIARKAIELICTEGPINITSAVAMNIKVGGSQFFMDKNGFEFKTPGYFRVHSGQHQFTSGERVIMTKYALPVMPTIYSNNVNYIWDNNMNNKKQIFIIDNIENKLLKSEENILNDKREISSYRFYTKESRDFTAVAFNSSFVSINQKYDDNNVDLLLEEALFKEEIDSEIDQNGGKNG